ncbi:hypothetical protein [uncultured Erythrobacter sp.]|uniref:hypothetical protein n=1 Tax=uncultured Erythrobacter sp. TaxID=263913 RepID=UPI002606B8AC|nr:hypothetical protein [uncultured Erythrobacter sp.]
MTACVDFEEAWVERLAGGAQVLFRCGTPDPDAMIHTAIADAFAVSLGLKPIGFNWELLDAAAPAGEPRSAMGEITNALSHDIGNPNKDWLDPEVARQCASDFLGLLEKGACTITSNRFDGLWNPIAGNAVEWGFVGFDQRRIALLLLAQD